ncbi:MAG: hypothetical protein KGZ68_16940 [Dechloromonas sp.]|nr:hypothetical protein [Dechloromonas sp.]
MLDAERWVKSRANHPFSFEFCCWQGLGQDPELIRETTTKHWQRLLTKDAAVIFATYTPPKDTENAGF